jgi:hypothetical protein
MVLQADLPDLERLQGSVTDDLPDLCTLAGGTVGAESASLLQDERGSHTAGKVDGDSDGDSDGDGTRLPSPTDTLAVPPASMQTPPRQQVSSCRYFLFSPTFACIWSHQR